jgi:hypothetical protein
VSFHHSWDETWLMAGEVHEQIAQLWTLFVDLGWLIKQCTAHMNFLFLCEAVQSCPLFLKQRLLDPVGRDGDGYYWLTGRVDDVINVRCVVIEFSC